MKSMAKKRVEKTTKPKPFCFVLMPFDAQFEDVYQLGIKESCREAGAYSERVDEQIFHETILDRIYKQIDKADFIIADMTGRNPNVFYEVGYAHALGKPTILLTQNADDIPFDLKHFPHIVYENKISFLKKELARRIRWFVAHPGGEAGSGRIDIDIYLGKQNLSSGRVVYECPKNSPYPRPKITIHNASSSTFEPGSFKLGIVTSARYERCLSRDVYTTKLPDGSYQHMISDFPTLFPGEYTFAQVALAGSPEEGEGDAIIFRVFMQAGSRDYPLVVRRGKLNNNYQQEL